MNKINHGVGSQAMVIFREEGVGSVWEGVRGWLSGCCLDLVGRYLGLFTLCPLIERYIFGLCAFLLVILKILLKVKKI